MLNKLCIRNNKLRGSSCWFQNLSPTKWTQATPNKLLSRWRRLSSQIFIFNLFQRVLLKRNSKEWWWRPVKWLPSN